MVGAKIVGKGEVIAVCVFAAVAAVIGDPTRAILTVPNQQPSRGKPYPALSVSPQLTATAGAMFRVDSLHSPLYASDCYWDWLYWAVAFTNSSADINLLGLSDFPLAQTTHMTPSILCLT